MLVCHGNYPLAVQERTVPWLPRSDPCLPGCRNRGVEPRTERGPTGASTPRFLAPSACSILPKGGARDHWSLKSRSLRSNGIAATAVQGWWCESVGGTGLVTWWGRRYMSGSSGARGLQGYWRGSAGSAGWEAWECGRYKAGGVGMRAVQGWWCGCGWYRAG